MKEIRGDKKRPRAEKTDFFTVGLPLSDVLFLHLFSLFPAARWSLSNRSSVFSKAVTIFDLSSNPYSEVVLARKRPTGLGSQRVLDQKWVVQHHRQRQGQNNGVNRKPVVEVGVECRLIRKLFLASGGTI